MVARPIPGTGPKRWAVVREAVDPETQEPVITTMHVYAEGVTPEQREKELKCWREIQLILEQRGTQEVESAVFSVVDIKKFAETVYSNPET